MSNWPMSTNQGSCLVASLPYPRCLRSPAKSCDPKRGVKALVPWGRGLALALAAAALKITSVYTSASPSACWELAWVTRVTRRHNPPLPPPSGAPTPHPAGTWGGSGGAGGGGARGRVR